MPDGSLILVAAGEADRIIKISDEVCCGANDLLDPRLHDRELMRSLAGFLVHVEAAIDLDHEPEDPRISPVEAERDQRPGEGSIYRDRPALISCSGSRGVSNLWRGVVVIGPDTDVGAIRILVVLIRKGRAWEAVAVDNKATTVSTETCSYCACKARMMGSIESVHEDLAFLIRWRPAQSGPTARALVDDAHSLGGHRLSVGVFEAFRIHNKSANWEHDEVDARPGHSKDLVREGVGHPDEFLGQLHVWEEKVIPEVGRDEHRRMGYVDNNSRPGHREHLPIRGLVWV